MKFYILKRLFHSIFVLVGISLVVFIILHLTGDPAALLMPMDATPEQVAQFRKEMGFTDPVIVQYWRFFKGTLHGDFGQSFRHSQPALDLVLERMPATVQLTFAALILALVIAVPVGIISAIKRNSILDHIGMTGALLGQSTPVFWLGIMLMMIFGVFLGWLPIGGRIDLLIPYQSITGFMVIDSIITLNGAALISVLEHLILPAIALGTIPMAIIARTTRSSMLEVLRQDFIRTERAKGLSERKVIYKHAIRNAMVPVVTVIGLNFGLLLSGAILTETVFSWPGVGRLVVDAVYARDYPLVIGCILIFALVFVIVNLITDILYTYIDPRIHYE